MRHFEMDMVPNTYQCGPDGKMRLNELMKSLQEIAALHAEKLGFGMAWMMENRMIWVLVDIKLKIVRMPFWNESCSIFTMPSGHDRIRAFREYIVHDGDNGEIIKATSVWMVIDSKGRKPVLMDDLDIDLPKIGLRNFEDVRRSPLPDDLEKIHHIKVGSSSIDLNGHVNNTEYVRWALDGLSFDKGFDRKDLSGGKEVMVSFRSEVFECDEIDIHFQMRSDGILVTITRENSSRPVFSMEID